MHWTPITRLFGMLLMLYSASFLPSIGVAVFYQDGQWSIFVLSLLICLMTGLLVWFPVRHKAGEISVREGYFVVSFFWILLGAVGSLPFLLSLTSLTPCSNPSRDLPVPAPQSLPDWMICLDPSSITASKFSGWAGWAS